MKENEVHRSRREALYSELRERECYCLYLSVNRQIRANLREGVKKVRLISCVLSQGGGRDQSK